MKSHLSPPSICAFCMTQHIPETSYRLRLVFAIERDLEPSPGDDQGAGNANICA